MSWPPGEKSLRPAPVGTSGSGSDFSAALRAGIEQGWHTAAQACILRQGAVVWEGAVGEAAPGVPATSEHIFLWLSAGKPLLATALALLWQDHLLDWDDPVARYLPAFAVHGKDRITLRHLLEHTGGFRQADQIRETSWPEQVAAVCASRIEPGWEPGLKQGYHMGASWTVLAAVLEAVTGSRVAPWMRRHLFEPLGMHSTWLGWPAELPPQQLVTMQQCGPQGCAPHPFWARTAALSACWPGSNTFSTARDMTRFYQTLLEGGRGVLEPPTVRELTTPLRPAQPDATFKRPMRFHQGFLFDSKQPGESWHSYGYGAGASPRTFGHGGNQCATAFADPEAALAVAVVFNAMPGELLHQQRMRTALNTLWHNLESLVQSAS